MILELNELQVNDKNISERVQIAKAGSYEHEVYGNFSLTLSDFEEAKRNFDNNVRRQTFAGKPVLPFDYSHEDGKEAAGWILSLSIGKDENGVDALFGSVEWTKTGAEKIRNKEYKFTSPTIRKGYKDSETGKRYGVVLCGAALTNIPFLRDMEAIHLLSEDKRAAFDSAKKSELSGSYKNKKQLEENKMMSVDEIMRALGELPEEEKKALVGKIMEKMGVPEVEVEMSKHKEEMMEMSEKLSLSETEKKSMKLQLADLTKRFENSEKEKSFNVLLSEGKACEAQRKAFMAGDMAEFARNVVDVKLSESGHSGSGEGKKDGDVSVSDKVIKLAEARVKEDKVDLGFAMSQVLSENQELAKQYYAEGE